MTTMPLSEAKARLSQIADEVHRTHERVTITKNGRSYLVLMAAEDLESIEATLELLADPLAAEHLATRALAHVRREFSWRQRSRVLTDALLRVHAEHHAPLAALSTTEP